MAAKAANKVTFFFGLITVLLLSVTTGTYAFAEEVYTAHISCTGIEESVLEAHMNPKSYMYDNQEISEYDTITPFVILGYYGDDGLINSYSIEKLSINGKEFAVPETAEEPIRITQSEISGICIDDDEGYIEISRQNNDLWIGFTYSYFDVFYDEVIGSAYLSDDLTIEVAFKALHTHSLEKVAEVPATCTEPGAEAYWKCSDPACGKMFSDEAGMTEITEPVVIPAKGHNLQKTEAKAASSTEAGNSEYYTCTECGKYFSDAEGKTEIAKDSWVLAKLSKKAQPMTVKAKKVTLKYKKIKKKAQTVAAKKAFTVSKAEGKVTYKLTGVKAKKNLQKQAKKKIKVASNGKITLKKGLKKGTYKLAVQVTAEGNADYNAASKAVTVKVVVK